MKIMTIVGARPQFIKAAAFTQALRRFFTQTIQHTLVHTGQHHDEAMSEVFFRELDIGKPDFNLGVAGGTHGAMTGRMMERLEALLMELKPDWVLIYGDTNSTLAGALAAAKLHIKVAHVEAGLRSFNRQMPEEINRIVADRLSTLLFCPTEEAVKNLQREGMMDGVSLVGDVMYDVSLHFSKIAEKESNALSRLRLTEKSYVLATCHRAENTDNHTRLSHILRALNTIAQEKTVVFPIHPRTRKKIEQFELNNLLSKIKVTEPLAYLDMILLESKSELIITDSGGVQKEAFFYKVPCITTRNETEWIETVENGWNELTGSDEQSIVDAFNNVNLRRPKNCNPYGDGQAADKILSHIYSYT